MMLSTACESSPQFIKVCPDTVEYSKDFKQDLKEELKILGSDSRTEEILRDYLELKKQVEVCN